MADGVAFRKGNESDAAEGTPSQRSGALAPATVDTEAAPSPDVERVTLPDLNPPDGDRVSFPVGDRWDRTSMAPLGFRRQRVGAAVFGVSAVVSLVAVASLAWTLGTGGGLTDVIGRAVVAGLSLGVAVGLATRGLTRWPGARRARDRSRAIVLAGDALILEQRSRPTTQVVPRLPIWRMGLHERFGLTLLSSKQRERLVALVTTSSGTFPLATRLSREDEAYLAHLVPSVVEIGEDDNALFAAGPDGRSVVLTAEEFRDLVARLVERDPSCLGRFVASDQAGRPVLLEEGVLTAQGRQFDLRSPVEWRSIQFQESFGAAVTHYQGTWVRQGTNEVVFVSLLPASLDDLDADPLTTAGVLTEPPPVAQRVAMEGFFVGPMRSALRRAPRVVDARSH